MKLNKISYKKRDALVQPYVIESKYCQFPSNYDIARFKGLPLEVLEKLIKQKFADPEEKQNEAPSIQEFLEYMRVYPQTTANGYIVTQHRDDYRISLEGIDQKPISLEERDAFFQLCRHADELDLFSEEMHAWFD